MTEKRDIRELALEALGFASLNAMQDDMLRVFPEFISYSDTKSKNVQ